MQHVPPRDVGVAHVARLERVPFRRAARADAIGRHRLDPHQSRERRAADLDLVEPRDEAVDGVGERLRVEDDGRHLADRGMAGVDEPATPEETGDDREHVGDLRAREPERPKAQRVALGAVGLDEILVDATHAMLVQPERLDGQATVDRLADGSRHRRVRGTLAQIALRGPLQIPPRADHDRRRRPRGARARPAG